MNIQNHATLKMTPYEVVFGLKPSSEPVQDLTIITEEITEEEHSDSDNDIKNQDEETTASFDETDGSDTLSPQNGGACIATYILV